MSLLTDSGSCSDSEDDELKLYNPIDSRSCSDSEDDEWELDNHIKSSAPTRNNLERDGTPETFQESFLERKADENETSSKDQDASALERALSQLKRAGFTGTIESFSLQQAKLLTKKRTKKTHAETAKKETPEEREKLVSKHRENSTKTCEAKMKNETPEEREKRLWEYRENAKKRYEAKMKTETPEEREKRLEYIKKCRIIRDAKRSEAEKKKITEKRRNRAAFRRANETLEEREKRTAWYREYQRRRDAKQPRPRKQLSESERAVLLEKSKVRYALKKASETPEEREERLAKKRVMAKNRTRRTLSPESLEKLNARRRELYRKKKLKPSKPNPKQNWEVKIEAVESSVLEAPTQNHSLHLEVTVEPDNLQETLLPYIKKEINSTGSPDQSSATISRAFPSDIFTS